MWWLWQPAALPGFQCQVLGQQAPVSTFFHQQSQVLRVVLVTLMPELLKHSELVQD